MSFDPNDILPNFDSGTFGRGQGYARSGNVGTLALSAHASRIDSQVCGSGGQPYQQSIDVRTHRHGIRLEGDCGCPMEYNCKHVVAVLLSCLEQLAGLTGAGGAEPAPPHAVSA